MNLTGTSVGVSRGRGGSLGSLAHALNMNGVIPIRRTSDGSILRVYLGEVYLIMFSLLNCDWSKSVLSDLSRVDMVVRDIIGSH